MDIVLEKIVTELKAQRKKQTDLANFLGITGNVVTDWKSGRIKSYNKYIHGIADFLGVSVEYLRGETDQKEKSSVPKDEAQFVCIENQGCLLTPIEQAVISAYRAHPELQFAVNKLLGVDTDATAVNPRSTGTA